MTANLPPSGHGVTGGDMIHCSIPVEDEGGHELKGDGGRREVAVWGRELGRPGNVGQGRKCGLSWES